ncbi:type II secretion system F family protein [Catenuloplanes indicus]|uniref:Flp pilus assembly protein TadB n=1 Tax=Catenuloplanes indicus TaxID=137267 RepID=A0AAE3W0W5_9ACTN|nr:hypothetical protein [Catenuloplanes indicus]MDQ0367374.1 Flp pilus assembly protein TadB [Catenuloplanes indicus]
MSTFWAAVSVLAATVAVLAGMAAFRFRSHTGPERYAVPARAGLFAQAATQRKAAEVGLLAETAAAGGRPAVFRFDGASGRFTPIEEPGPAPLVPKPSGLGDQPLRSSAAGPVVDTGSTSPDDDREPVSAPGAPGEENGRRRAARRMPVRLPRTTGGQRLLVAVVAGSSALAGLVVAGPVGMLVAVYCRLGVRGALRRQAARSAARARTRTLDMLCTLAADLRAGLPHTDPPTLPDPRIGRLTTAAWRLAERTGAPVADLVERIESDTRAMARGQAAADAEAAGARATAWLLAALPAGGLVLGAFMGVDPLHVLLHTPIGAACAIGAVILQSAGLAWANRLATSGSTP